MSLVTPEYGRDHQIQALATVFLREHRYEFRVVNGKWWSLHPLLQLWSTDRARIRAGHALTQIVGSLDPHQYSWIYRAIQQEYVRAKVLAYLAPDLRSDVIPGPGWTIDLAAKYPEAR